MKDIYILILFRFVFLAADLSAQPANKLKIYFQPIAEERLWTSGTNMLPYTLCDSILIETLRFYISGISLANDHTIVYQEPNSYHLLDAADMKSLEMTLSIPQGLIYDQIKFNLGIDSTTNAEGVKGGALDPTWGMYWTWQSGYIHFKLEGQVNQNKTAHQEFQFHLGGFQGDHNSVQKITLDTKPAKDLFIGMDLAAFFREIDLSTRNHIMSPGPDAVQISQQAARLFYLIR